jgi:hypothetical protein
MKSIITVRYFLIVFVLGLFFGLNKGYAQQATPETRAMNLTLSMNCEIGLYQDQMQKVNAINLEAAKKMDAAKKEAGSDANKLDKLGKKISMDRDIELRDVLTPSQYAIYEKISRGDQTALKKTAECRKNLIEQ